MTLVEINSGVFSLLSLCYRENGREETPGSLYSDGISALTPDLREEGLLGFLSLAFGGRRETIWKIRGDRNMCDFVSLGSLFS